jgi:hypothetical protein
LRKKLTPKKVTLFPRFSLYKERQVKINNNNNNNNKRYVHRKMQKSLRRKRRWRRRRRPGKWVRR